MEIKTKLNIGDSAFKILNDKVGEFRVAEIDIIVRGEYREVLYKAKAAPYFEIGFYEHELGRNVFTSKQELLDAL